MKRILALWLAAALFTAQPCYAVVMVGFGQGVVDYCADKLGSFSLYYDADHPDGTNKACISGGTTDATLTLVTASDTVNATSGGTYGILWDGMGNKYVNVPATGISTDNGHIEFDLVTGATLPTNASLGLLEWFNSVSASIYLKLQQSGGNYRLTFYHYDGATISLTSNGGAYEALATNTAYHIVIDWSGTTGKLQVGWKGNLYTSATAGDVAAFTTPSSGIRLGESSWSEPSNQPLGFDNIVMGPSQQ